jgi:hypothetical protein
MSSLSGGARWAIIVGGYVGYRALGSIARQNPDFAIYLWPLLGAYVVFAATTWLGPPLFNLLLQLNRFGRLALSRDQRISSIITGIMLLSAVACILLAIGTGDGAWIPVAVVLGICVLPASLIFVCEAGWPRLLMTLVTLAVIAIGITSAGTAFLPDTPENESTIVFGTSLWTWFVYAVIGSQFAGMYLANQRVRR